jgi:hypothetical protein
MLGILAALTAKALPTSNSLVIIHATIIDVRNGQLLRDQTILATGDRITSMSDQPIEIPARAEVVNVAVPKVSKGLTRCSGSQSLEGFDETLRFPKSRRV